MNDNLDAWSETFVNNDPDIRSCAIDFIEMVYSRLVRSLNHSANATVPRVPVGALKFWWDQELDMLKVNAIQSQTAWMDAGKPSSGVPFDEKKRNINIHTEMAYDRGRKINY